MTETMNPDDVETFLRAHPDFLQNRPALLAALNLPHGGQGAVSLVERQVAVLRERNSELRRRFDALISTAEQNETLLAATQEVIAAIAERGAQEDIATLFCGLIQKRFSVELVAFHWRSSDGDDAALSVAAHLLANKSASSGPLRSHELHALFGEEHPEGSAALATLTMRSGDTAIIAVGSTDATRYGIADGTLFLEYLARVIGSLSINQPED